MGNAHGSGSKGKDFIMIDLLSPDSNTTTSTETLGAIVLTRNQWEELTKFIEKNRDFDESLKE